ncbi:MAG: NAD(P)/FAD-dependent oxidoreductase [Saprospiraceae bacterium]|nr:NAD(P)/FAD-dependent oxidoreductase [Saprospiraceae bacterium]
MASTHHQIVIIGGGTAGITVAAQLLRADKKLDVAIIDPAQKHYYQAAWTLVGAGDFEFADTERNEADLIPNGATWIQEAAAAILPDDNKVALAGGDELSYDFLVVCPGIQIDLDGIEGLRDALGKNEVCSNYTDPNYTWEVLQNFKGGTAIFTQPATPIKCGGAPQKIMYMAEEYFQKAGLKDKTKISFITPGTVIFGMPDFAKTLMQVVDRKGIELRFFHKLTKIDGPNKTAYYTIMANEDDPAKLYHNKMEQGERFSSPTEVAIPFDMLHLAPPQSAPDFIKRSPLVHADGPDKGWVNVDINTLQHKVYPNVFSLGDSAALPTAKTGAAVRKQAPVVVGNLLHVLHNKTGSLDPGYEGYSSCPIVTGYGKMLLAEFKYDNVRDSDKLISFFVDTTKEQYSMYLLKKYGLPFMYWNLMLKGLA